MSHLDPCDLTSTKAASTAEGAGKDTLSSSASRSP